MNRLTTVGVLAVSLLACKKSVKTADVEAWMKGRMQELGIGDTKVTCPKDIKAKKDATFECTVDVEGKTYTVVGTVTEVTDSQIKYDTKWKGEATGVVIRKKLVPPLEAELEKQFATKVAVGCPEPLIFLDDKRTSTCDLTAGKTKAKIVVTYDDKLAPTQWKVDPPLLSKAKLEEMLTASVREQIKKPDATVDCGTEPLIARPADGFVMCTGSSGTDKSKLKVEVDADLNVKRWDAVP